MGFESLQVLRRYKTNKNDIVKEFYLPILKESILYKRAVGFFSSTALIELSKGISGLIKNGGHIKFIVSPLLSEEDVQAIQKGYDEREIISNSLMREFKEPVNESESERLNWLAYLIANDFLEIKVAFTPLENITGMYHEKSGILYDNYGNRVAFTGSMNETTNAFHNNFESIQVFNSLKKEDFQRVDDIDSDFDSLWNNLEENINVIDFPEAVKNKLLSYHKDTINLELDKTEIEETIKIDNTLCFNKTPLQPIELYPYQNEAIENWVKNNYCGIFDMATGTGKTYTGLGAITRLFNDKKRLAIIIVCPYQHLVEQWVEDIIKFNMYPIIGYSASKQKNWKQKLKDDIEDFKIEIISTFCFVTTNATFSTRFVQQQIEKLGKDTILLVDEAHNFGSKKLSKCLNSKIQYRLALSATLDRYGDPEGTNVLYNYFGKKCIEYDLEKAIKENKLTPYYYYPVIVYLDDEELEKYKSLSYEISSECFQNKKGKWEITQKGKMKLIERARVIAGAKSKIPKLKELLLKYVDDDHILVYCGATKIENFDNDSSDLDDEGERQIDVVSSMMGNELNMKVTHFTSSENSTEREIIKEKFANADPYQAIIAIKCLDEGVNIPSIKTAFILASTTNPKEYIQRRGRVLRKAPGKSYATIYDFVTLATPLQNVNQYSPNFKCERALAKRELLRIKEFGNICLNSRIANELMLDIENAYDISTEELEEEIYGTEFEFE